MAKRFAKKPMKLSDNELLALKAVKDRTMGKTIESPVARLSGTGSKAIGSFCDAKGNPVTITYPALPYEITSRVNILTKKGLIEQRGEPAYLHNFFLTEKGKYQIDIRKCK